MKKEPKAKVKDKTKTKVEDEPITFVTCNNCGNEQADMGRNVACEECGEAVS